MRRFFLVVLASVLVISLILTGCAGAKEEAPAKGEAKVYEWRMAGVNSAQMYTEIVKEEMCKKLEKESDGRIKITHYGEGVLGDWDEVYEEVMRGVVEVGGSYIGGAYDINSQIHLLPYISTDVKKIKDMLSPGGTLHKILSEVLAKDGLTFFGEEMEGWIGISLRKVPADINNILDPTANKRALKIRAMPGDLKGEILISEWGFSCAMTPWAELYLAFETGIVDGDVNNSVDNMYTYFRDVLNCWIETKTIALFGTALYTNTALWNTLSAADQKLIAENMQWVVDECVKREPAVTAARLKQWEAEGCTVVYPTEAQLNTLKEYTQKNVWPRLAEIFDKRYLNMIFEEFGLPTTP